MSRFLACIDLHAGRVKQIVGGTLSDGDAAALRTNFVSDRPAAHFASLYRAHGVRGSHVVMLGRGNEGAAREALAAWPGALQVGGGVDAASARRWVDLGAEKVRCVPLGGEPCGGADSGRFRSS
jgi:phosphoribosylformimino-5-aminoimidazole carboxamide ribotide isomerase